MVDGQTIGVRAVWAGRMPQRRVEHDHRTRGTLDRHRRRLHVLATRRLGSLMGAGYDEGSAIALGEVVEHEHPLSEAPYPLKCRGNPGERGVERSSRWRRRAGEDEPVLQVQDRGVPEDAIDDGQHRREREQIEEAWSKNPGIRSTPTSPDACRRCSPSSSRISCWVRVHRLTDGRDRLGGHDVADHRAPQWPGLPRVRDCQLGSDAEVLVSTVRRSILAIGARDQPTRAPAATAPCVAHRHASSGHGAGLATTMPGWVRPSPSCSPITCPGRVTSTYAPSRRVHSLRRGAVHAA